MNSASPGFLVFFSDNVLQAVTIGLVQFGHDLLDALESF